MKTESVQDFQKYVKKDIITASNELEHLAENQRRHLSKLVYTNLVNRFDSMVDQFILDNCREDSILEKGLEPLDKVMKESDILRLLIEAETIQDLIDEKIRSSLSTSVLRKRHSVKLSTLFEVVEESPSSWKQPRVEIGTGKIRDKVKPSNKKIPCSICGYADWLYSRRNALVHGAGVSKLLENDKKQLEKLYNCKAADRVTVRLSSINTASKFYLDLVELFL